MATFRSPGAQPASRSKKSTTGNVLPNVRETDPQEEQTMTGAVKDELRRYSIDPEVLLESSGLHKASSSRKKEGGRHSMLPVSVKAPQVNGTDRESTEADVEELQQQKALIPPDQRFSPSAESYLEELSRDVESAADLSILIAKRNASRPQKVFEQLKTVSVERWASMPTLFRTLWKTENDTSEMDLMEDVINDFEADIADLRASLEGLVGTRSEGNGLVEHKGGPPAKRRRLEPAELETLWNQGDEDTTLYTDSEDDEKTANAAAAEMTAFSVHPPFLRPLRRLVRSIRKTERFNLIFGKCYRTYDETQSLDETLKENVHVMEDVLYTPTVRNVRQKRNAWREWRRAASLALCKQRRAGQVILSATPGMESLVESLRHFQVAAACPTRVPALRFCRHFLRYFAEKRPALLEGPEHQRDDPLQWCIPNIPELLSLRSQDDTSKLQRVFAKPGERFYVGHALSIWGSPMGAAYLTSCRAMELMFWLKRFRKPFEPLHVLPSTRLPSRRPNDVATQLAKMTQASASNPSPAGSESLPLNAALRLHTDDGLHGSVASSWGGALRIATEKDSSESEGEAKERQRSEALLAQDATHARFHRAGYSHDNDVVRLGRFGRLRSVWDCPRRRRVGYELLHAVKNPLRPCPPIAPEYSSSEESQVAVIESQKPYRVRARASRALIKSQKARVVEARRQHGRRQEDTEVMKTLFQHGIGPLETRAAIPERPSLWPACVVATSDDARSKLTAQPDSDGRHHSVLTSDLYGQPEECLTHVVHKKRRVRRVEPRADRDPKSKLPIGFIGFGTDVAGKEMQLVGIDQSEVWRRFGEAKAFCQSLGPYADVMKGCRDYYAVINEQDHTVTVIPGSTVSLFWTHSARQAHDDMHWYAYWYYWSTGRFRRRFGDKALRYQRMHRLGWYIWQSDLDKLQKIKERLSEMSAYRHAKYCKPRVNTYMYRRTYDKQACPTLETADETTAETRSPVEEFSEEVVDVTAQDADKEMTTEGRHDGSPHDVEDWEEDVEAGPTLPRDLADPSFSLEHEAECCRMQAEQLFRQYRYHRLFSRPGATIPSWALAWMGSRRKIRSALSQRYAHVVSRYFHGTLPAFQSQYEEGRTLLAEKHRAEVEYATASKQRQKATEGESTNEPTTAPTRLQQTQLKGALLGTRASNTTTSPQALLAADHEEKLNYMRSCLPSFQLNATEPQGIYDGEDILPSYIVEEVFPAPMDRLLEEGIRPQDHAKWTQTVISLLQALREKHVLGKGKPLESTASRLKILNWLIKLYLLQRKTFRTSHALSHSLQRLCGHDGSETSSVPKATSQWICERFFTRDEAGEFYMKPEGEIKLVVTILWLCVFLHGDWQFDFTPLVVRDWGPQHAEKFQKWARLMGLRRTTQHIAGETVDASSPSSTQRQSEVWRLEAPLRVADDIHRARGVLASVDATFGRSTAAAFFKEGLGRQGRRSRRGR